MLSKQEINIPLVGGLDSKSHPFAISAPYCAICENVVFTEPGSMAKRWGHAALGSSVDAGGDLSAIADDNGLAGGTLSNIRGMARRDDELVCFGENSLDVGVPRAYSWSKSLSKWVDRGHYEGVEVTSKSVVNSPAEQIDADRAEYRSGDVWVIVYAWSEYDGGTGTVHLQVFDGNTGAVLSNDIDLGSGTDRPRCINVDTKLQVWYRSTSDLLKVKVIDPTDVSGTINNAAITFVDTNIAGTAYDIVKRGSTQAIIVYNKLDSGNNRYEIAIVNSAGSAVTTATKTTLSTRAGGDPLVVAYQATADRIAVFRVSEADTKIYGDIINGTSLADVTMSTLVVDTASTGWKKATASWRTIADGDGKYKCIFFASYTGAAGLLESTTSVIVARYLRDDASTAVVAGPSGSTYWSVQAEIASRAFTRGSKVYFMLLYKQQTDSLQLTYILYREDGLIIARPLSWNGGIVGTDFWMPQFEALASDRFAVALTYRQKMTASRTQDLYSDHNIKDIVVDFASLVPYRGVQIGKALYMAGGYLAMYDGLGVVEQNFLVAPYKGAVSGMASTGGSMNDGTRTYKLYWAWRNAQGELERSTYIDTFSTTFNNGTSTQKATLKLPSLVHTMKLGQRTLPNLEVYRTEAAGSTFYLVTSLDPTNTSGLNGHLVTDLDRDFITTWSDGISDTDLVTKVPDYLNSGELDNLTGMSATMIAQGQSRLFIAGMEDPNKIWYSKLWQTDDVVAFNDALELTVPPDGGPITGIGAIDSGIIVWKKNRIYLVNGLGPDNLGNGAYTEPQLLSADTGCSDVRTLTQTPQGWLFKSPKGWRLLSSGNEIQDIGSPVADYDSQTFYDVLTLEDQNLILCVTSSGKTLAYDYFVNQWSTWTAPLGIAAKLFDGGYVVASTSAVTKKTTTKTDSGSAFNWDVETPWLYPADMLGFGRLWEIALLGEYMAAHNLRVRIYYNNVYTAVDDITWTTDTSQYEVRVRPSRPKSRAFKFRFTDVQTSGTLADSLKAVSLMLKMGTKKGLSKQPSTRSI